MITLAILNMDVHVISLEDSSRRKTCKDRLISKGYNPIFHDAFDSRNLNEKRLEGLFEYDLFRKFFDYKINPEVVGCAISHHNLYKTLVEYEKKSSYYMIVEDDCIPLITSNELEKIIEAVAVHKEAIENKMSHKKSSEVALFCTIQMSVCLFGLTASAKAIPRNVLFA